ncbi:hypothetical protein pqer_cds_38 [Pandoravirus quercus]|uniref:Uncharacterized protein n=2 Tax=Pandoravirus TaxID=2060084 RepID=A0A2U7U7Q6_9VIRU|nr:hypothetical protein pqer_cds_38 [Pandoravirus quercus]AVK74460.1 hypothetical protein pqer_cds_38 [Pandoravirus quercus]
MTAPLPIDATTHTVRVRLLSTDKNVIKTFDVPLERFSIYRTGCLTGNVIDALDCGAFGPDGVIITDSVCLPSVVTVADADRIMELVGLMPVAGAEPSLAEVVRLWPALRMLEARHAIDRCYASLVSDIALDSAESILAVYLFDAMCAEQSVRRHLGRDNVLAPLMPMGGSTDATPSGSAQSIIDYMTLRDRLIDLAMAIESEALSSSKTAAVSGEAASTDAKHELRRAMVAMVTENRSRAQKAVAEALRDWSLPLHAIDQVFATDFSMARPLADAGARWLMTGDAAVTILFEQTVRDVCPAFTDVLLGNAGILAAGDAIMAGGAVVNAIQRPEQRRWLSGSDIDLWIVGVDHAERTKAFERTIRALFDAMPGSYATITGSVVTVQAPVTAAAGDRMSAPVQVILTPYHSASQVVCGFDMSHACAYYDGTHVYATWSCVCASVTRVARALPGKTAKAVRVTKAKAKGFDYVGAPPAAQPCSAPNDGKADSVLSASQTATAGPLYSSADDVISAFCFRPLTSDDYTVTDGDAKPVNRDVRNSVVPLSKRFALAMPLMTIAWRAPKSPYASMCPESIGFRLLDAKDAGASVSCHRADAMNDYREARKNIAASALADLGRLLPSLASLRRMVALTQIRNVAQKPGRFAENGFEFVTVHPRGPSRIVDGITGAPMRIEDLDASRQVFSGTMSLGVGLMGLTASASGDIYCSKRMERLRVYPRAFVSTAARVMASAAIIAADRFADRVPTAETQ